MIQITPQMCILVAVEAVDGRKGIDSLARLCQEKLQTDPFSGCLFVFRSRCGTAIRRVSRRPVAWFFSMLPCTCAVVRPTLAITSCSCT